jgi:hypothetical protein
MPHWALVAVVYGLVLTAAALILPIRKRLLTASACLAYVLLAAGAGTVPSSLWLTLTIPAALLLGGYWLSGLFFQRPQGWLEAWLLRCDRSLFRLTSLDDFLNGAPLVLLELLEASYAAVYVVIAAGAIAAASAGTPLLDHYWTLVLTAELACYVWLPVLRSRPPRAVETPGVMARRGPRLRRWNGAVLNRASVQANTLPSGHVAGAVAAALGVLPVSGLLAGVLLVAAGAIALAAVAGRYHYAVDCAAGALVAVLAWSAG